MIRFGWENDVNNNGKGVNGIGYVCLHGYERVM